MTEQKQGSIQFIQSQIPVLQTGKYKLDIQQAVSAAGSTSLARTYQFYVDGDRFALAPGEVSTVYPPEGSTGNYANDLPHIVLTRKTLPWEHSLTGDAKEDPTPPWLALLVFGSDAPPVQSGTLQQFFPAPTNIFSGYFGAASGNVLTHETLADTCQFIDLPLAQFQAAAPSLADLSWLAHARLLTQTPPGQPNPTTSDFAVVIANRLPQPGASNIACLVSLDGLAGYLPGSSGTLPAGTTHIRLVVLKSWSFTAAASGSQPAFSQLFANLNHQGQDISLLSLPQQSSNTAVNAALQAGYVPLPHTPREGGKTISWYRGPFIPYPSTFALDKLGLKLPVYTADEVTRADQVSYHGTPLELFDLSYAAAWELGRLLALANRRFATALYNWKRGLRQGLSQQLTIDHLSDLGGQNPGQGSPESAIQALVAQMVTNSLTQAMNWKGGAVSQADRSPSAQQAQAAQWYQEKLNTLTNQDELSKKLGDIASLIPPDIKTWFGQLALLRGVPFYYLVPDARLLPDESLRFFRVDAAWIACLIDGANSIGRSGRKDQQEPLLAGKIFQQACAQFLASSGDQQISGFLLRSKLADGWWPGMRIEGYPALSDSPDGTTRLPVLRSEKVAPGVLLVLFQGDLKQIDFHPPPEGLHFGLTAKAPPAAGWQKDLRDVSDGQQNGLSVDVPTRDGSRVIQASQMAADMKSKLNADPFTAAEFSIQMVQGVPLSRFQQKAQ